MDFIGETIHNLVEVLLPQSVLVAVLDEAFAGVDKVNRFTLIGVFFVENNDTSWNTGPIKQVCRQTDDGTNVALVNETLSDDGFLVAAEENSVGQNNGRLPTALEGLQDVEEESVVAVFRRRRAAFKPTVLIVVWVKPIGPTFDRERRICHGKVESFEASIAFFEMR